MVALAGGMLALLVSGLLQTGTPVVVDVDGEHYRVQTHASTVGLALQHAGFELHPEDLVSPDLGVLLEPGVIVQVQRARPVTLGADGHFHQLRTRATTVGELLAEAGVVAGPADELWLGDRQVSMDTPLSSEDPKPRQVNDREGRPSLTGNEVSALPPVTLRRATHLTLDDNGLTVTLRSTSVTVGEVLQEHGVGLFLGDEIKPGLQDRVTEGMKVTIVRSVPVRVEVDGRLIHTRSRAETVAGVLGQAGIALMGKDRVQPNLTDRVRPDMVIRVTRIRQEYAIESEPIPFETTWVSDPEVEIDNIRLVQEGQVGLTKRRYQVTFENDQEVGRVLEDVWPAQEPITKTMAYGTKIVIRSMDTPDGPIEYWRKMRVYTVSYKPASSGKPKSHPRYGYTRLGWKLVKGIVATDPTVIPLRTKMYVPGYGLARAGDTGGGVKGKLVDLGFEDDDYESWHWWTDIYLLTPVPSPDKIRWVLPNWPRYPDRGRR